MALITTYHDPSTIAMAEQQQDIMRNAIEKAAKLAVAYGVETVRHHPALGLCFLVSASRRGPKLSTTYRNERAILSHHNMAGINA